MASALDDVRVLDLTRVVAGPFGSSLLADLGAEVIKVELPGRGDDARYGYPSANDVPVMFLALNRNKKGITLDLRKPRGQEVVRRLLSHCDVLVENFAPGTMAKWGLDYEALRAIQPRLIYAALSGFGQTGPYAHRTSYDLIAQAMSGLMSLTGFADGPPVRAGGALGDYIGGVFMALAVLAALRHRDRTGEGQFVDVSNMDAIFAMMDGWPTVYAATGRTPSRRGNRHPSTAPYDCFAARDGYVVLGVGNNQLFRQLMAAIGLSALAEDPRFRAPRRRLEHQDEIHRVVGDWVASRTVAEVMAQLGPEGANIPCAPVMAVEQLVHDPHLQARGMLLRLAHPKVGEVLVPGVPFKLSASPGTVRTLGPELGQHTDEVLRGLLRLSDAEVEQLRAEQVI